MTKTRTSEHSNSNIATETVTATQASELEVLQSYVLTAGCVLSHVINAPDLSNIEKLCYLSVSSIASINEYKLNIRAAALPARSWAKMLNCSSNRIFDLQKSLERKGYFSIDRNSDGSGRKKRNKITPILPDHCFSSLLKAANNHKAEVDTIDIEQADSVTKLRYVNKTKLFVKMNYDLFKCLLASNSSSDFDKLLFLDLYLRAYKSNHKALKLNPKSISVVVDYKALAVAHNYGKSAISVAIKSLRNSGLISVKQLRSKHQDANDIEDRKDKSLWEITLHLDHFVNSKSDSDKDKDIRPTETIKPVHSYAQSYYKITIKSLAQEPNKNNQSLHSTVYVSGQLYNKDLINKDIDRIDKAISRSENKSPSVNNLSKLSKSFNSDNFDSSIDVSNIQKTSNTPKLKVKVTAKQNIQNTQTNEKVKEIRSIPKRSELVDHLNPDAKFSINDVKPLTEEEASILRSKAGRNFSLNFMNQLLSKLKKKRESTKFVHWNFFRKYFVEALKRELRLEENVSFSNYQMSINANSDHPEDIKQAEIIKESKKIESYLSSIENSQGNSEYEQLKRKIAGSLKAKAAYAVLTRLRGCRQIDDSQVELEFCRAISSDEAGVNEDTTIEIIKEPLLIAIRTVYSSTVNNVVFKVQSTVKNNISSYGSNIEQNDDAEYLASIPQETMWGRVRKSLISCWGNGGQNMDKNWFSRIEAIEDHETKQLCLKAPSRFVRDWVNQNYSDQIKETCKQLGISLDGYKVVGI